MLKQENWDVWWYGNSGKRDMATWSFAKSFNDINVKENKVNSINIEDDTLEKVTIRKATSLYTTLS